MAELTITIKDSDVDYLAEIAEREWRHPEQQASALLEQALDARRVRISTNDKLRIRAAERKVGANGNVRHRAGADVANGV
jgi:hypothetical protein